MCLTLKKIADFINSMPNDNWGKKYYFSFIILRRIYTTNPKAYFSVQLFCLPKLYPNRPVMVGCCSIIKIYVYYHIVFKNTILLFTRRMFVENCCFILKRCKSYTSKTKLLQKNKMDHTSKIRMKSVTKNVRIT